MPLIKKGRVAELIDESEGGRMTTLAPQPRPAPAALEARLLNLFAPTASEQGSRDAHGRDMASLWRMDAIHRAKNLAQLSTSLANVVTARGDRWGAADAAAPARALARTYDALSRDGDSSALVPCFDMVSEVAVRLGQIFGRARNIGVHFSGDEVFATPEHRRVLALIGSELVINALKYAFPGDGPGMIAMTLGLQPSGIELVVADNGVGIDDDCRPGQGKGLLDRLAYVSGAVLARSTSHGGGLCVTVGVPFAVTAEELLVA